VDHLQAMIVYFVLAVALLRIPASLSHAEVTSNGDCQRECDGSLPRRCVYNFHVEYYYTMSKACFDCPLVSEDCDRYHCIAADGVERGIVVINRQLPGPTIQVCQGDQIVVNVKNHLLGESCSIHWHGMHMVGTPYMDGVPLVTQCPIPPGSTFRYTFNADNPGTHFWHSHSGFQRADGSFGSLVIRQKPEDDPYSSYYDFDLPEHVILVSDWLDQLAMAKFVAHHHDDGDNKPPSMIINGRGRRPTSWGDSDANMTIPLARFHVQQDLSYRFRVISNGFLNCPIQFSVDNHTLLVIASDGEPIDPIEVDSFVISAGERYDVVLNATQEISNYWIRLHGLMDCNMAEVFQAAVLQYDGAPDDEPDEILTYENTWREGKILNPVNIAPGDDTHVTVAELTSPSSSSSSSSSLDEIENDWSGEPDHKFFLGYDFNAVNSWEFHDKDHYPIFGVQKDHQLFTPQINHMSLRLPSSPLLSQLNAIAPGVMCNESTVTKNCTTDFCDCTYTLDIPLGALVELLLIDEGVTFDATHPFHLHGGSFRVVAMNRLGSNVSVEHIRHLDATGQIQRNLVNAPIKDTVSVPDGGYTIVRFRATNPGFWLFHCHLSFHIEVGMGLIFRIGQPEDLPPVPKNFPTCGNWLGDEDDDNELQHSVTTTTTAPPVEAEYSEDTEEANSIETTSSEENAFDNVLSLFNIENDLSDESLTSFYHENSIANNHLVNGSVSHPEFDPITESGSAKLSAMWFVIWLSLSLLFNWR